jgi:signal peptidase I
VQYISRVIGLPGETIEVRDELVYINDAELHERRVIVKPVYDFDDGMLEELSSEGSGPYSTFHFFRDKRSLAQIAIDFKGATFGTRGPFKIPDQQYFLMGDNRDFSYDSRAQGTVPRELIWGKATVIYWSSHANRSHEDKVRWERIGTRVK